MKKQVIAKLLVLAMVLAMVPATILAASAVVGNSNSGYNYGYYSIAADTVVTADSITNGVIDAKVVGGVVLVAIPEEDAETVLKGMVKNGVLTLEVNFEGDADKCAVSVPAAALLNVLKETGADFVFKTPMAVASINGEALIEAIEDSEIVMFVAEPAAETPVTVYVDWVAVDFGDNMSVEVL